MEMNKELIAKAKSAKSIEELTEIAKENGIELNEESAKAYFELLHPQTGEVSDEELDNVSGGGCYKKGQLVVTVCYVCEHFKCKKCGSSEYVYTAFGTVCSKCGAVACCNICTYCTYKKGLWLCTNDENRKS